MLGEGLAVRDHNVTILSPYFVDNPPRGIQYLFIDIKKNAYEEYAKSGAERSRRMCPFFDFANLALLSREMCYGRCNDQNIKSTRNINV